MVLAGAVLYGLARLVGAVQTLLRLQRPRRLTAAEATIVRTVFRSGLDPDTIRVVPGRSGLFGLSDRPVTIGDTVYLKESDPRQRPDVLVHECTHVWQFGHVGSRYLAQALWAQWTVPHAYDWRAESARGHTAWTRFNREAQAQLVQDVWRGTSGAFFADDPVTGTFAVDGVDHTGLARDAVAVLRGEA